MYSTDVQCLHMLVLPVLFFLGQSFGFALKLTRTVQRFKASTQGFSELQAFRSAEDNTLTNTRSY